MEEVVVVMIEWWRHTEIIKTRSRFYCRSKSVENWKLNDDEGRDEWLVG
jgi:hypothetical protein